jgi:DNA-binding HxlR family transcriptional regulator
MMKEKFDLDPIRCTAHHIGINDTTDVWSGKWKIRIIGSLGFGKQRFMELKANIDGIAAKMLSKEFSNWS